MRKAREPLLDEFHKRLYAFLRSKTLAAWTFALSTSPWLCPQVQVALSSLDLLTSIVATFFAAHPGGLDALAVDDASAGLWISPEVHPCPPAQCLVQPLPSAVNAPEAEVVVDGFPGREIMREQTPGAAAPHHVEEDGVEDLAQGVHPRASGSSRGGEMGLD